MSTLSEREKKLRASIEDPKDTQARTTGEVSAAQEGDGEAVVYHSAEERIAAPSSEITAVRDTLDARAEAIYEGYLAYADEGERDISRLKAAYNYAYRAHVRQKRVTGEPYITHPLAVATILLELEVDQDTLIAALLHDTVEDTSRTLTEIEEKFGQEVEVLVDGVTKLDKMTYSSRQELQAENFRKMFLAMAKDIRVVLIKLADRLHNMRTMKHMPLEKQERIARETLDIYAPLADRLGVYKWKWELEDLCLRYIDPTAFYELVGAISQRRSEREAYLNQVIEELRKSIEAMGIHAEIEGRPKHFYSIYRKMKTKGRLLDQIYDLFACRVIVDTVSDCYAVLGMVHDKYRPMPGRFKDYIAVPKPNMYQSLHTTVFGPKGFPFEVQIRTFEMHRTAEYGIAAHWRYKAGIDADGEISLTEQLAEDGMPDPGDKLSWLRQLLEWQKDMRDSDEFMDALKSGLVPDEVFVFTPRGDVINLPTGSVPIDFAYHIHSAVGNHMYGAKVNGKIVPMAYELKNGDIVEILTSDKIHGPSRDWLKLVKSNSARNKINHWFKKELKGENIARGREIVDREIKKSGFTSMQLMRQDYLRPILKRYSLHSVDDLFAAIGSSQSGITPGKIIPKLRDSYIKSLSDEQRAELGYRIADNGTVLYNPVDPVIAEAARAAGKGEAPAISQPPRPRGRRGGDNGVIVEGLDNIATRLAPCCSPVPGDDIIGFVTRGNGVTIHRKDCSNMRHILQSSAKSAKDAEKASRLVDVHWDSEDANGVYQVVLKITARDRRHLLGDISNAIAEERVSIISGNMSAVKDVTATLDLVVEVTDQAQYDRVLGRIKAVKDVIEVKRGY